MIYMFSVKKEAACGPVGVDYSKAENWGQGGDKRAAADTGNDTSMSLMGAEKNVWE